MIKIKYLNVKELTPLTFTQLNKRPKYSIEDPAFPWIVIFDYVYNTAKIDYLNVKEMTQHAFNKQDKLKYRINYEAPGLLGL
jgi:hypothetical protein